MSIHELAEVYISQSGSSAYHSDHDAHQNGTTHTNSSGHHADSKQTTGGGHGDHYDSRVDY